MTEKYQNRVRDDLTRVACEEIGDVVNRRMRIAATVLDEADMTMMLTQIAASVLRGAIIFGVQRAKDDHAESLVADIMSYIAKMTEQAKPEIFAVAVALNEGTRGSALMDVVHAARSGSAING